MKARFRLSLVLASLGTAFAVGCGGGDGASGTDPASVAPADSVVFVEGTLQPEGQLKSNTDAVVRSITGIDRLGGYIVEQLESSAEEDGEPFDFDREVKPWLGETGGVFFERLEDGDLTNGAAIITSTDADATQEFIDKRTSSGDETFDDASYEGVDYKVNRSDDTALALIDGFLVVGEETGLKKAIDASGGEALAGQDRYDSATRANPDNSLADAYVDVGGLLRAARNEIDDEALQALKSVGIDPSDATAVVSVVPGDENVEIDLTSDLGGEKPPSGDASELLGSLPGDSFAAFAVSGFGDQLQEALDSIDESGIPGQVPPHQLKKGLKEVGIDLEGIAGSLRDAGLFAIGNSESSLEGALVLSSEGSSATDAIDSIRQLLRGVEVEGVTPLKGGIQGFAIRSEELGPKPLVIAARDGRLAIGYGLPATRQGLDAGQGQTLSDNPNYDDAVAALGSTPISGFVDGAAALRLADALVPSGEEEFEEAKPYLEKARFVAIGSGVEDDLATAKLVIGLEK